MKTFQKHYTKAIEILDMLNELLSDISLDQDEEELEEGEYEKLYDLYNLILDTEAQLSDGIYDEETFGDLESNSENDE